jgi:putative two-component system response regulator
LAAVLLDVAMPVMSGVEFLKIANERNYMDLFPVLLVTGEKDIGLVEECFDYGISDFIRKPVNTDFVKNRVDRLVDLYQEKNKFKAQTDRQTQTLQNQYKILQAQSNKLRESNENIIRVLGTIVEYRNMEMGNHIPRIGSFTEILATQMMEDYPEYELTPMKIRVIVSASALHDVGKILIPDSILLKPGKLTDEEFEYMKSHSILGYGIIDQIASAWDDEYVQYSKEITRWHHEKYDIPIAAQIVSLADCYDALINDSVYHEAYSLEDAYRMIRNGECGVFSPKLLSVFNKTHAQLERSASLLRDAVGDLEEDDDLEEAAD